MEGGVFVVKVYLNPNKDTFVRTVGPSAADGDGGNASVNVNANGSTNANAIANANASADPNTSAGAASNTTTASINSNDNSTNVAFHANTIEGSIGTSMGSNIGGGNRSNVRSGEYDMTQPLSNTALKNASVDVG